MVSALMNFIDPSSRFNRRYVAPNEEINTGIYEEKLVTVNDAGPERSTFTLDTSGFALLYHESKVSDFRDKSQVEQIYVLELQEFVRRTTGAHKVIAFSPIIRQGNPKVDSEFSNHRHQTFIPIVPRKVRTDWRKRSFHNLTNPISSTHALSVSIYGRRHPPLRKIGHLPFATGELSLTPMESKITFSRSGSPPACFRSRARKIECSGRTRGVCLRIPTRVQMVLFFKHEERRSAVF